MVSTSLAWNSPQITNINIFQFFFSYFLFVTIKIFQKKNLKFEVSFKQKL